MCPSKVLRVCVCCLCSLEGMETLNGAIESLTESSNREDWMAVTMNVADATVTVISEGVRSLKLVLF